MEGWGKGEKGLGDEVGREGEYEDEEGDSVEEI